MEDILKSFYLCIRFPEKKADIKEAIFEEIYENSIYLFTIDEKQYYLVELERGENEVDLRILPNGTIL